MHACIGEGNGNPLQYLCLENPRDRGAWWAAIHGVTQSRTQLKWLSSSSSKPNKSVKFYLWFSCSVMSDCSRMHCSKPGFPVLCQLPELVQTQVHWVGDAIQPSHPLSSPSVFSLSQHQGLFKWLSGQSIGASPSASILPMNIQGWFPLGFTGWISLLSKGL